MNKAIFILEYMAEQPLLLRTEGIYDVSTRLIEGKEVPSIISRKMIRPLRDTLRNEVRKTGDKSIDYCKFPTEEMCCWCLDCLIFGGTRTALPRVQLRSLVHPSDALAVVVDEKSAVEAETHVAVKEGRIAEIGEAFYSPFQVPQGTRFIGTLMIDFDKTKVDQQKLINLLVTMFLRTRRYGGRTAQEGLVKPKVLAIIEAPYECVTSYDLYKIVKPKKEGGNENWKEIVEEYIKKNLKKSVPDASLLEFQIIMSEEMLKKTINELTEEFRRELEGEGINEAAMKKWLEKMGQ